MSDFDIWLTIFGLMLLTLLTRTSFSLLPSSFNLPPLVQRALRYAPACTLAAIIAPDLLLTPASSGVRVLDLSLHNHRLLAGIAAALLFMYTRNMLLMIAAGLVVYTGLRLWA